MSGAGRGVIWNGTNGTTADRGTGVPFPAREDTPGRVPYRIAFRRLAEVGAYAKTPERQKSRQKSGKTAPGKRGKTCKTLLRTTRDGDASGASRGIKPGAADARHWGVSESSKETGHEKSC